MFRLLQTKQQGDNNMANTKTKVERYSYSKLNVFASCGWKYKLVYIDGHYTYDSNLSNELGSLIHALEEKIALAIIAEKPIDYDALKKDFVYMNIPKSGPKDVKGGLYGIDILKDRYHDDFYKTDEHGQSYFTKSQEYLKTGIYRLENFMKANPNLSLIAVEQFFSVEFGGNILSGYIDRILYDNDTDEYVIVDIKTKDHPFADKELVTPLQFVIYSIALKSMYKLDDYPTRCVYDLPICNMTQDAGTKGFIGRGIKKITKILEEIDIEQFEPHPSPLCYWCPFSYTNPSQKEEGKKLCCYYSLWKPNGTAKAWEKMNEWQGIAKHEEVMHKFLTEQQGPGKNIIDFPFDF